MTAWMLWAIVVGVLLAASAHVLESTLRAFGRPGRWAWVAAVVGALGVQVSSIVPWPQRPTESASSPLAGGEVAASVVLLKVGEVGTALGSFLQRFDLWVLIAWVCLSLVLLVGLVSGILRLQRRSVGWTARTIDGVDVLVSDDFGPALLGIRAPQIVLPGHVVAMDPRVIRVICAHEAEHRAARDTWLLTAGALLASLMPWNLALWWKVMRLREAIEIDCDERVLSSGVSRRDYGVILLDLAADMDHVAPPVPAFAAQPTSLLERRLTTMIIGTRRKGILATAASTIGAVLLGIVACQTPAPTPSPSSVAEIPFRGLDVLSNDPLIFVDGERVEGPSREVLQRYSPEDIESIEIIKGPHAMNLYGDEAANGVIVIVLK